MRSLEAAFTEYELLSESSLDKLIDYAGTLFEVPDWVDEDQVIYNFIIGLIRDDKHLVIIG